MEAFKNNAFTQSVANSELLAKRRQQVKAGFNSVVQSQAVQKGREQVSEGWKGIQQRQQDWKSMTPDEKKVVMGEKKQTLQKGLQNIGGKLQQNLNLGKLIDQMERDQGLADSLEQLNERIKEDKMHHDMIREAEEACMKAIRDHLDEFLEQNPNATYEQWIEDLHPENTQEGALFKDLDKQVDLRFYVQESDHLQLWNQRVPESKRVQPRAKMFEKGNVVDLLSGSASFSSLPETDDRKQEIPYSDNPSQNHEQKEEAKAPPAPEADLMSFDDW